LESFFNQFPQVPPEVIVKDDLLRLGLNFTPSSLEAAQGCRVKSYRLFTYDRVKHDQLGQGEPFKVPEDLDIIRGPYSLRRTNVQVRINPDSPYRVEAEDGKVLIREADNVIAEVEYSKAPDYYMAWCETWSKYKLPLPTGFGPMGPGLATNGHSSYMDMDPVLLATGRHTTQAASA
ncbi:MAG: hypothetical protein Q8O76_02410, partial [Chloroflexota bacterium]|nr:hypothetical protein [Chloroflexota bacterium]